MVFATYLGQNHFPFRDCETLSERLHTDDLLSSEARMDVYLISQRIVTGDVFYNRKVDIAPKLSFHPGEDVAREVSCDTCDIVVCRLDDELLLHQVDAQEEEVPR
jgi:hypothetical protein